MTATLFGLTNIQIHYNLKIKYQTKPDIRQPFKESEAESIQEVNNNAIRNIKAYRKRFVEQTIS